MDLRLRKQAGVAPRKGCADRGWCHRGVDTSPRRFFGRRCTVRLRGV